MIVILSPAKNLVATDKTVACALDCTQPNFLDEAQALINILKEKKAQEIAKLMHVSDAIADLNYERYHSWAKTHNAKNARHAVLTFNGAAYQGLDAASFSNQELEYSQKHLRILSGLYGILKPLDYFQDYRLEMGTRLENENGTNLYHFWSDKLNQSLQKDLNKNGNILVNLASNEYSKALKLESLDARIITCHFKDKSKTTGEYKTIMAYAKKARGLMSRFIIKNKTTNPEDLLAFDYEDYRYDAKSSSETELTFLRG